MKKVIITFFMLFAIISSLSIAYSNEDRFDYGRLQETFLNQDPDPVMPGEYVELRFKVTKEGNKEIEDIKYELIPKYPFSFDGSDSAVKELGDWGIVADDSDYYTLYYKLYVDEKALEDSYNLTIKQSSSSNNLVREFDFPIRVDEKKMANLVVGNIVTTPSKLTGDYDEGLIDVEITNNGDSSAENVIAQLYIPEGFEESFGYSNRENLGTIDAGETKTAQFYVDTSQTLLKGNYETLINLNYKESNDDVKDDIKSIELPFNINIFGRPFYEIKDISIDELIPGTSQGQIRINVENIGDLDSDSTSIQIYKDSSQPFSFKEKSVFVGPMEINEDGEVVFLIDVKEDAIPKEYKVKLQLRSVVDSEVYTEDKTVDLVIMNKENAEEAGGFISDYLLYLVVLIVGIIIGSVLFRKKKKEDNIEVKRKSKSNKED